MRLIRCEFGPDGIFGHLYDEHGEKIACTLEHAYKINDEYLPKVPNGTYTCVRGTHILQGMRRTFDTFEITGVPGHSGILFHIGNRNDDSDGCVLLGSKRVFYFIEQSAVAFHNFMNLLTGIGSFQLTVSRERKYD